MKNVINNTGKFWMILLSSLFLSIIAFFFFAYVIIELTAIARFYKMLLLLTSVVVIIISILIAHKILIDRLKKAGNINLSKSLYVSLGLSFSPVLIVGFLLIRSITMYTIESSLGIEQNLILGFKTNSTNNEVQAIIYKLLSLKKISKGKFEYKFNFSNSEIKKMTWNFYPTFHNERLKALMFLCDSDSLLNKKNLHANLIKYLISTYHLKKLNQSSTEVKLINDDLLFVVYSNNKGFYSIFISSKKLRFKLYEKQPSERYKMNEWGDSWSKIHSNEWKNISPIERLNDFGY